MDDKKDVNKDFFINKKEFIINVNGTLNLFFGAVGCRYYTINDVSVIPNENSNVTITFETGDDLLFNITINVPIDIYQRQISPFDFKLNVGEKNYTKYQCYEGILKIEGNCIVIQKPSEIRDL